MATTTERNTVTEAAEEELLASFMGHREEDEGPGIEHPLLLAALMRRREEGDGVMENPLLLAALGR